MHTHRYPPSPGRFTRRDAIWAAALTAALVFGGGAAYAAIAASSVSCDPATSVDNGDGTVTIPLHCRIATPDATLSPSSSASPTAPSPSPSTTTTSTSPTASTTSSAKLTNCFTQLAACGYPTAASTGVPAGTTLTTFTGDMSITTAGAIVTDRDIHGCVDVHAPNVTIRNSRITGPCVYGISTDNALGATTISHVEVNCTDGHGTAINGPGFIAVAVNLHDCENGFEINQGSSVVDSAISSREATSDGHGDDIQSQAGNNITIRHNTFAGLNPITSSIITNPNLNSNWLIEDNFLSAGAYTLYCPEQGTGFTVRNNRFYPPKLYYTLGDRHSAAYGLTDACNHTGINWTGNYLDSNLATVGATA